MTNAQPRKHSWVAVTLLILAVPAFLATFFIAVSVTDSRAQERAAAYCASIEVGADADGLIEAARSAGGSVPEGGWINRTRSTSMLMARFTGVDSSSGYLCTITVADGRVVAVEPVGFEL